MKSLTILMLTLLVSSLASANNVKRLKKDQPKRNPKIAIKGVGNGGDILGARMKTQARYMLDLLNEVKSKTLDVLNQEQLDQLNKAIDSTEVFSGNQDIIEQRRQERVDAIVINVPNEGEVGLFYTLDSGNKNILLNQERIERFIDNPDVFNPFAIHEFLRAVPVNDDNYVISSKLASLVKQRELEILNRGNIGAIVFQGWVMDSYPEHWFPNNKLVSRLQMSLVEYKDRKSARRTMRLEWFQKDKDFPEMSVELPILYDYVRNQEGEFGYSATTPFMGQRWTISVYTHPNQGASTSVYEASMARIPLKINSPSIRYLGDTKWAGQKALLKRYSPLKKKIKEADQLDPKDLAILDGLEDEKFYGENQSPFIQRVGLVYAESEFRESLFFPFSNLKSQVDAKEDPEWFEVTDDRSQPNTLILNEEGHVIAVGWALSWTPKGLDPSQVDYQCIGTFVKTLGKSGMNSRYRMYNKLCQDW